MLLIIITIMEIVVILIVIAITKIKVIIKRRGLIRGSAWNNMINLFIILSLYSNVIILTNQCKGRSSSSPFSSVYE